MIVSRGRNFVWLHNPKVAGTSFRRMAGHHHDHATTFWGISTLPNTDMVLDSAHLTLAQIRIGYPEIFASLPRTRTVVFVRDPYERFISACFEYHRQYMRDADFENATVECKYLLVEAMIERLTAPRTSPDYRLVHFAPQKDFVFLDGRRIVEHVVPLKRGRDLQRALCLVEGRMRPSDLKRLYDLRAATPHLNATTGGSTALVSGRVADFVRGFYADDYEMIVGLDLIRKL